MVKRLLPGGATRNLRRSLSRRQPLQRYWLIGTTAIALSVMVATPLRAATTTKIAGFFGLPIPNLPIPGGSVEDLLKGAVVDQAVKALGSTLKDDAPIESSSQATFPTVNQLPGTAFKPKAMPTTLMAQLRNATDGAVALQPGDYRIPVNVFCMKVSAHSPAGHRYLLAPLKGKWADIIVALNARSAGTTIPHPQLQVLSWNLQAGMKYEELATEQRAIVDQLLPDYKPRLSRSFYEQIESTWSQLSGTVPGLPSMDSALGRLGDVGSAIVTLRQTRDTLLRYGNNFEALSNALVLPGQANTPSDGANTPWSQISPRVYARLMTKGTYADPGELQIRVTVEAPVGLRDRHLVATTDLAGLNLAGLDLAAMPVKVPLAGLVGDPQDSSVQPLSMSPKPEDKDEDESGSGSLQIQERGFSGPQPPAPLNQV
ncbi:hypothetical protein [Stenomitos frigidus]|uniref:Uncharacterized protein n=1 Tax=Stenomitos frigidus ULC18 TaxID=2107698 RepID=A0A2T1E3C3_9CYAN|nr:hypothetical protein [Stenomitos frigidus]PSB27238.1 hypothetical protein C7B82_17380 [Stenomitos frigidus ULC18]